MKHFQEISSSNSLYFFFLGSGRNKGDKKHYLKNVNLSFRSKHSTQWAIKCPIIRDKILKYKLK